MTMQISVAAQNARLDALETLIGTTPLLRIYSGAMPANCAAASTGTLLAEMTLPTDWMSAASAGAKAKLGTWQDIAANAAGVMGYYRIYESTGTTCHVQATITATGGGGDLLMDNINVAAGQNVSINTYTWTDNNG